MTNDVKNIYKQAKPNLRREIFQFPLIYSSYFFRTGFFEGQLLGSGT